MLKEAKCAIVVIGDAESSGRMGRGLLRSYGKHAPDGGPSGRWKLLAAGKTSEVRMLTPQQRSMYVQDWDSRRNINSRLFWSLVCRLQKQMPMSWDKLPMEKVHYEKF